MDNYDLMCTCTLQLDTCGAAKVTCVTDGVFKTLFVHLAFINHSFYPNSKYYACIFCLHVHLSTTSSVCVD